MGSCLSCIQPSNTDGQTSAAQIGLAAQEKTPATPEGKPELIGAEGNAGNFHSASWGADGTQALKPCSHLEHPIGRVSKSIPPQRWTEVRQAVANVTLSATSQNYQINRAGAVEAHMAAAHTQAHCLPEGNNIINIDNSASNTCVNTSSIPNNSSTTRTSNNNNNNSTKGGPVLGAPLSPLRLRPVSTPIAIPANPVYTEAPTSSTAAYPCPQNISTLPVSDAPSTMHHSPPAINGEQVSMMAATPSYLSSPSFERLSVTSSTGAVVSMPTCTASTTTVTCSQLHPGVARCHEFQSFSAEGARRSGPRARVMRSHSATTKGQGGVGAGSLAISTAGPGGEGGRSPVAGAQFPPGTPTLGRTRSLKGPGATGHKRVEAMLGYIHAHKVQAEPRRTISLSTSSLKFVAATTTATPKSALRVAIAGIQGAQQHRWCNNSILHTSLNLTRTCTPDNDLLFTEHGSGPHTASASLCSSLQDPLSIVGFQGATSQSPLLRLTPPTASTLLARARASTNPQHPVRPDSPTTHVDPAQLSGGERCWEASPRALCLSASFPARNARLVQLPEMGPGEENGDEEILFHTLESMIPNNVDLKLQSQPQPPPGSQELGPILPPVPSLTYTSLSSQRSFTLSSSGGMRVVRLSSLGDRATGTSIDTQDHPGGSRRVTGNSMAARPPCFTRRTVELPVRAIAAKQALPGVQGMAVGPRGLSHSGSGMKRHAPITIPRASSARLSSTDSTRLLGRSCEAAPSPSWCGSAPSTDSTVGCMHYTGVGSMSGMEGALAAWSCDRDGAVVGFGLHSRTQAMTRMLLQHQQQHQQRGCGHV